MDLLPYPKSSGKLLLCDHSDSPTQKQSSAIPAVLRPQGFGSLTVPGFCRGCAEGLQPLFTIVPTLGPVLIILQGAELAVPSKALGSAGRDELKQVLLWEVTPGESPPACRGKEAKLQPEHTHQLGSTCHHLPTSLPDPHPFKLNKASVMKLKQSPVKILNSI